MDPRDPAELRREMEELEREIAELPVGYISRKNIGGKVRLYHQWYEDGKVRGVYLKAGEDDPVIPQIERRKELQSRLKVVSKSLKDCEARDGNGGFFNRVLRGGELLRWASGVDGWRRRDCYGALDRYLRGRAERVCVLYGLRRTGKTTLIRQAVLGMSDSELDHCAYIRAGKGGTMSELNRDIRRLREEDDGLRFLFIDEVTELRDFIDGADLLSDIYVMMGVRIVLSGTDSLGFWIAQDDRLFDRSVLIHTTYIPFREHSRVLGTDDVDAYIEYGGTLSVGQYYLEGGVLEPDVLEFFDPDHAWRYTDRAIARNIQNSLKAGRSGRYMDAFLDIYEAGELTNVINRVVEDIDHRFVEEVVNDDYESVNLMSSTANLDAAGEYLLDDIDRHRVTEALKRKLSIRDGDERLHDVTDGQLELIRRYLRTLDVISEYREYVLPDIVRDKVMVTQPGLRYAQVRALVESISEDGEFRKATQERRDEVLRRVMDTVRGRMLEEIVLHDTSTALGRGFEVFKLRTGSGREVDMVVRDRVSGRCLLFEVKHSASVSDNQVRHLVSGEVSDAVVGTFGEVAGRHVLYRGEDCEGPRGVGYLDVSRFLSGLPGSVLGLLRRW